MRPIDIIPTVLGDIDASLLFVKFDEEDEIRQACARAAHHRLAVNGWVFFEIFRDGRHGDKTSYDIQKMTMCFDNHTGIPVGCAVMFDAWGDLNAGCFVRNEFRRRRIGSKLISSLLFMDRRPVRIHNGITGSMDFWKVVGANEMDYIGESSAPVK